MAKNTSSIVTEENKNMTRLRNLATNMAMMVALIKLQHWLAMLILLLANLDV